jgi:hypothetical protein
MYAAFAADLDPQSVGMLAAGDWIIFAANRVARPARAA